MACQLPKQILKAEVISLEKANNHSSFAEISIQYSCNIKSADRFRIRCSQDADKILRQIFPSLEHREFFYILILNRSNQLLGYHQVSSGGIAGTQCDVRIVFQSALKANASAVIAAHNHPSGNLQPSDSDLKITQKIKQAGEILDINLLDHLILNAEGYISLADENLM